jgi:hypothetical protein
LEIIKATLLIGCSFYYNRNTLVFSLASIRYWIGFLLFHSVHWILKQVAKLEHIYLRSMNSFGFRKIIFFWSNYLTAGQRSKEDSAFGRKNLQQSSKRIFTDGTELIAFGNYLTTEQGSTFRADRFSKPVCSLKEIEGIEISLGWNDEVVWTSF